MERLLNPEWLDGTKTYPFPNWGTIRTWVKQQAAAPGDQTALWNQIAREWMQLIGARFSSPMLLQESPNFILASPESFQQKSACLSQLEDFRLRIGKLLGPLGKKSWGSKCAVIIAPDHHSFVSYILDYFKDGAYGLPGGVYLNRGYGHFVLPNGDLTQHTSVLAHELCHAVMGPRDMPSWLNEAITQTIEHQIAGRNPYFLDSKIINEHRRYWNPSRIEEFWTGKSFFATDEGCRLSYHLSLFLWNAVSQYGQERLLEFSLKAQRKDAGFEAARSIFGIELNAIVSELLGWRNPRFKIEMAF